LVPGVEFEFISSVLRNARSIDGWVLGLVAVSATAKEGSSSFVDLSDSPAIERKAVLPSGLSSLREIFSVGVVSLVDASFSSLAVAERRRSSSVTDKEVVEGLVADGREGRNAGIESEGDGQGSDLASKVTSFGGVRSKEFTRGIGVIVVLRQRSRASQLREEILNGSR
jgi:hypothetical protein